MGAFVGVTLIDAVAAPAGSTAAAELRLTLEAVAARYGVAPTLDGMGEALRRVVADYEDDLGRARRDLDSSERAPAYRITDEAAFSREMRRRRLLVAVLSAELADARRLLAELESIIEKREDA